MARQLRRGGGNYNRNASYERTPLGNAVEYVKVRRIVARRLVGDRVEYRVQWVGCGPEEDTWEPVTHLAQAQRALADFHRRDASGLSQLLPRPSTGVSKATFGDSTAVSRRSTAVSRHSTAVSHHSTRAGQDSASQTGGSNVGGQNVHYLLPTAIDMPQGSCAQISPHSSSHTARSRGSAPSMTPGASAARIAPSYTSVSRQGGTLSTGINDEFTALQKQLLNVTTADLPMLIFLSLLLILVVSFIVK